MGDRIGAYRVLVGRTEGKRPLEKPRRTWGIILKWIFRKWNVGKGLWKGSIWLRIGTGGGLV